MRINERIKHVQALLGLKQEEFSRLTGISTPKLIGWYKKGAMPNGASLEQLCLKIENLNPAWLLTETGPVFLRQKKWRPTDEVRFRGIYGDVIYLFDNAFSADLVPGYYQELGVDNWRDQVEVEIGKLLKLPLKILSQIFSSLNIPFPLEYYAQIIYRIIHKLHADAPLESNEAYILCSMAELNIEHFCKSYNSNIPDNTSSLDVLFENLPTTDKNRIKFYKVKEISRPKPKPKNVVWVGIKRAFRQLIECMNAEEIPNICPVHNKLYWHKCDSCGAQKSKQMAFDSNSRYKVDSYEDNENVDRREIIISSMEELLDYYREGEYPSGDLIDFLELKLKGWIKINTED